MIHTQIRTRLNLILDIEYPILQEGINYATGSTLASAVSNAGGLGVLPSGGLDPDILRAEIQKIKESTSNPFGVSISLKQGNIGDVLDVVLSENVKVVITSGGSAGRYTRLLKEKGCCVIHEVSSSEEAKQAERVGVDAVIARGIEAGGYHGKSEMGTFALTSIVSDAVKIPVIALGGITDGRSLVASLALGAEGVQIGTRFIATWEAEAHQNYKDALVQHSDTVLVMRKESPLRLLKNKFARQIKEMEDAGVPLDRIRKEITQDRFRRGMVEGDVEEGALIASQGVGQIKSIKSVQDIIREMLFEIMVIKEQFNKHVLSPNKIIS